MDKLKASGLLNLPHVEHALRSVDRAHFIPPPPPSSSTAASSYYYRDAPQPIGSLATITSPSAHCIALQALFPTPLPAASALRCLDIGSGSGYLTLCLALLSGPSGRVWGVEHAEALVESAVENVKRAGFASLVDSRLMFVCGNGMLGLPHHQLFDVIHCGAAVDGAKARGEPGEVAGRLLRQLSEGGVLLIPEITSEAPSSNGGSKWSFTFTAASQSLNLYRRLPSSTEQLQSASHSLLPLAYPYSVHRLMHCSYAPMRSQPPPADIDSPAAFQQQTRRLAEEVGDCEKRVKQWHQRWKAEKGGGASEADRTADAALQTMLQDWRAKSIQLAQRRQIELHLQSAQQDKG